jgi:hypothetical protein
LALKDGALAKIANLQLTPDPLPVGWNLEALQLYQKEEEWG